MRYVILALACGLSALTGCQNPMENPYFRVKESGLNWVEIRQYKIGTHTQRIRVRLDGNGIVTVREGTSPLVGNPFASDVTHSQWADIRETRLNIPRDEALLLMQTLVDRGLFDKQKKPKKNQVKSERDVEGGPTSGDARENKDVQGQMPEEYFYVSANIQCKTAGSRDPVTDPDLIEHLKMIVMMFYRPTPVRRN